jgi:hypothetical protein
MYYGDFALGSTLDIKFTTVNTLGAPTALSGSPSIAAYPNNSTTEITSGITLTTNFDSRTGLNNVRVVATGANGYATDTNYALVITAGTVDGVSVVGYVVGAFSIEARSALRPATAGRTLAVESDGMAHTDVKEWLGVAPNALVSGRVDGRVGAMANDVITASAIASNAITAAKIADGALTAAKFAAGAFDAVWSVTTRVLTAGTNIVLAKGTGITGFNDPTANDNADALLDRSGAIDGKTPRQIFRGMASILFGKVSGAGTGTETFRDTADTKDRFVVTVDNDGNRSAITEDLT